MRAPRMRFRLCQAAIPDEGRVAHCLAQNKRNLSPACKIVFSRPRTAAESAQPNRHPTKNSY